MKCRKIEQQIASDPDHPAPLFFSKTLKNFKTAWAKGLPHIRQRNWLAKFIWQAIEVCKTLSTVSSI